MKGKPAAGVYVVFHPLANPDPNTSRPRAHSVEDGSFTLSTNDPNDGAPAGEYVVTFRWFRKASPAGREDHRSDGADLLGGRYADRNASKFKVEVKEGVNTLEPFKLD